MSDPITRAEALIRANPRERAAYEFGRADGYDSARMTNQSARACGDAAATYLLLADVEPDPLSYAALEQLAADTAARLARLRAALTVLGASSVHTFPAADAEAQEAARALVGGVR